MRLIRNLDRASERVPELAERAGRSLDSLDDGVRRANATMAILAGVAILALIVATVAIVRTGTVPDATR